MTHQRINARPFASRTGRLLGRAALLAAMVGGGVVALSPRTAAAQDAGRRIEFPRTGEERGVTKPVAEHKLVLPTQGVVRTFGKDASGSTLDEGSPVKKDQLLAILDDRAEQAQVKVAEAAVAAAKQQIEASKADLALKEHKLKMKFTLYGAWDNLEVMEAKLERDIAIIAVAFRELEHTQELQKLEQAKTATEQKQLHSPIDGVIAKIDVHVGEGADLSKPAFLVIDNTTLYVEADVPTKTARLLEGRKEPVEVRYADEEQYMKAEVVFLSPYANAASNTRKVRLKMDNVAKREAGLPVFLKMPAGGAGGQQPGGAQAAR
ncbi:MAG TPA: efflux RND transporter periplasmic adaptor subunit [Humisphaera sp.]